MYNNMEENATERDTLQWIDGSLWMTKLPSCVRSIPIIDLATPGSHNSFSYSITRHSHVSPDAPKIVKKLSRFPLGKRIIYNWAKGQDISTLDQLYAGIRYFDIRLVACDGDFVIAHGLYGSSIGNFLSDINKFLQDRPQEIIVLDFQHFYKFTTIDHLKFCDILKNIFDQKLCPNCFKINNLSLETMKENGYQIIVVYRNQETVNEQSILWPSNIWPTPWPNKINTNALLEYLDESLKHRPCDRGFVTQCVLTPTTTFIILNLFGSLKRIARKENKKIVNWLSNKEAGRHGVNVVICDFVENYQFIHKVIALNFKLANELSSISK